MRKNPIYSHNLKIKAVELLALGNLQQGEIAKEVGITHTTLNEWKKDPNFIEAIVDRSRELLRHQLPHIYQTLQRLATEGDIKAIKLTLEHLERIEELKTKQSENSITFTWNTNNDNPSS